MRRVFNAAGMGIISQFGFVDDTQDRAEFECRGNLAGKFPSAFMVGHKLLLGREMVLLNVRAIELCSH